MIGEFLSLPTARRSLQVAVLSLELLGLVLVLMELGRRSGVWGMGLGLGLIAIALLIYQQGLKLIHTGDDAGTDLRRDRQSVDTLREFKPFREFDQFREFVDRMPVPTFIKDRDSVTVYVNPCYESIFGSGWVGKSVWDYFPKSVAQRMVEDDLNALEAGATQITEAVPVPDGSGRMFQTLKFPLYQEGQPSFLAGFGIDVTDRKLAEATVERINTQLALSNTELASRHRNTELLLQMSNALQACPTLDAVATTIGQFMEQLFPQYGGLVALAIPDQQNFQVITTWGLLTTITATDMATVPCQNCWDWRWNAMGDRQPVLAAEICSHWQQPGVGDYVCLPIYSTHAAAVYPFDQVRGVLHLYQSNGSPIAEAALQLAKTTITSINLTLINIELRQALHEQSIRDPLTHLFNRRYLTETLHRELARASRDTTPIGVIMIDVDYFKKLNDTHGHAAGDRVLQSLAHLLRSHIRQGDIACRYGGEEFVIVMPTAAVENAYDRAEQIRLAFASLSMPHEHLTLRATLSAGVAVYPLHGNTYESLLRSADNALYQAKAQGRNQARVSG